MTSQPQRSSKAASKLSHEAHRSSEECVGSHVSHRPNCELSRFAMVHTNFFTSKVRQPIFEKGVIICESFTRKPRRNELFWAFWSAAAKPVMVYCRPPDYTTRDGLRIVDGAQPWCGPARRLASPCVGRTSGAPSCALFHSPVPGPGHVTRYSANVPWRP